MNHGPGRTDRHVTVREGAIHLRWGSLNPRTFPVGACRLVVVYLTPRPVGFFSLAEERARAYYTFPHAMSTLKPLSRRSVNRLD